MTDSDRRDQMVTALGAAGAVMFSPVVLSLFDEGVDTRHFGIPLLFLAVFVGWAVLIALLAIASRGITEPPGPDEAPASKAWSSRGSDD